MIGTPVTPSTFFHAPILVVKAGQVVHVGDFISGSADDTPHGRVTVTMHGSSVRFDAENGYQWRVIPATTAVKLRVNLDAETSYLQGATEVRERINRITKVKP